MFPGADKTQDDTLATDYADLVRPKLSKFEVAKAIGMRAYWLSYGAHSTIYESYHDADVADVIQVAKLELQNKCMPLLIHKYMPDGTIVQVDVNEH